MVRVIKGEDGDWIEPIGGDYVLGEETRALGWRPVFWPLPRTLLESMVDDYLIPSLTVFYWGGFGPNGECLGYKEWGVALIRDLGPCIAAKVLGANLPYAEACAFFEEVASFIEANNGSPGKVPKRLSEGSAVLATLALADEQKRSRA